MNATREELAYGLLWTVETDREELHRARQAIYAAFGQDRQECARRGIEAALALGHEADHPTNADYWAGIKDET